MAASHKSRPLKISLPTWTRDFFLEQKPTLETFLVVACAFALLLTRPTAAGSVYTPLGMGIIWLCSGTIVATSIINKRVPLLVSSPQVWMLALLALYYGFLILTGRPYQQDTFSKAIVILISGAVLGFTISTNQRRLTAFFDTIARVLIVLSISSLITTFLLISGVSVHALAIGRLDYGYNAPAGTILLPFSMLYNYTTTPFGVLPRLSGFFREVGIFPAYACWAAGYAAYRRWSLVSVGACLTAAVASFSTMGAVLALVTVAGLVSRKLRIPNWLVVIGTPALAFIIFAVTYNLPFIGLGYKYTQLNQSYSDRSYATLNALDVPNPLLGSDATGLRNVGINLIASISVSGLVGFSIVLVCMLLAARDTRYFSAALLPLAITALFAQPIGTEPLFLLMFLSWKVFSASRQARPLHNVKPTPVTAGYARQAGGRT